MLSKIVGPSERFSGRQRIGGDDRVVFELPLARPAANFIAPKSHGVIVLEGDSPGNVFEIWQKLLEWVKFSKYRWRRTHELEKVQNPQASEDDLVLDLYLPIEN